MRQWRRAGVVTFVLGLLLTLLTACADTGTVKEVRWHYDSLGNSTCDLKIRPDDMDSAAYWVTNRRKKQCDQCSVNARWPSCATRKEGGDGDRPAPREPTITWNRAPAEGGDRPIKVKGGPCSPEGAPAQTAGGVPMRCRDGKWALS